MKVSIVIPNYNGEELLKNNLPKVLTAIGDDAEIIIVDDGSKDKSLEVSKNFKVKIVVNEKNLGFSSTVNRGVKESKGDIVVLLNTDVIPEKDFLIPLLPHFKDPKVFAVGCLDKSVEKGKMVMRGRGLGKFRRGFLIHKRGKVNASDTLWVNGGSGAFRRSLWIKLGGFDPLYNPFYWEDIDLSYRALKSGYKIIFESKSKVNHYHERGIIKMTVPSFKIKIVAYRNQFIFVWKNITDPKLQILHFIWLPYHFIKAILLGDLYFLIGFLLALIKLPEVLTASFKVQKLFIKKDKEII